MATSETRKARRRSFARNKMTTKRFTGAMRGSFQEKPVIHDAVRVNGDTVAIGGHFYPGHIEASVARVVNVGRPAAARYEAYGPQPAASIAMGGGSSTSAGTGSSSAAAIQALIDTAIRAHSSQHYINAHSELDPPNREHHAIKYNVVGGMDVDETSNLRAFIEGVGLDGGGTIIIASENGTDPIRMDGLVSTYHDNTHVIYRSPIALGKLGGPRIMGSYDEIGPREGGLALALDAPTDPDDKPTKLYLRTGHGAYLSVGDRIVIRGENDATGQALYKDESYVSVIDGDTITLTDELENIYEPEYPLSEYEPDHTTGSTVYIVRYAAFPADVEPGTVSVVFPDADVEGFAPGDYVVLRDDRTEHDYNPAALKGNGDPYLNPAVYEITRIVSMVSESGDTTVTYADSIRRPMLASAYGGMSKLLPVRNSSIEAPNIYYYEDQENRKAHPVSVTYAADCRLIRCKVDGSNGQRGHIRISYCYNVWADDCAVDNPKFTDSGDGYGGGLYYSRFSGFINSKFTGCRHSILFQLTTQCAAINNRSLDDRISGIDVHGVNSYDTLIANNIITRSNRHTGDSSRGAGILNGNTSHIIADHGTLAIGNIISGYSSENCSALEFTAASSNVTFQANQITDCYNGLKFQLNSSQITPVQTAKNIIVDGNTFTRCTNRLLLVIGQPTYDDENSNGKLDGFVVKNNRSVQNARHFEVVGADGISNVEFEQNTIIDPIDNDGYYAYSATGVARVNFFGNKAGTANRGIYYADNSDVSITHNQLHETTEDEPITDGTGNTGTITIDLNTPFTGGGSGGDLDSSDFGGDLEVLIGTGAGTWESRALEAADISDLGSVGDLDSSAYTAKGDALIGTGSGTFAVESVGADDTILVADSGEATGRRWAGLANDTTPGGNSVGLTINAGDGKLTATLLANSVDTAKIGNDQVTNAKLANMAAAGFMGQIVGGSGDPVHMTPDQALDVLQTATDWASAVGGYLPLTGGTITNTSSSLLTLNNSNVSLGNVKLTFQQIGVEKSSILYQNTNSVFRLDNLEGPISLRPGTASASTEVVHIKTTGVGILNDQARYALDVGTSSEAASVTTGLIGYFSAAGETRVTLRNVTDNVEVAVIAEASVGEIGTITSHNLHLIVAQSSVIELSATQITNKALTVIQRGSDAHLRLDHTSATGNPMIELSQTGTRRSYIQHVDTSDILRIASEYGGISIRPGSGGTAVEVASFTTGIVALHKSSPTAPIHFGAWTRIEVNGDEILRLGTESSTGNPFISFYQDTTRRSYIIHHDTADDLRLASEYGVITLRPGAAGSVTERMRVSNSEVTVTGIPLMVAADTDTRSIIGRAAIGAWDGGSDFAMISHYNHRATTNNYSVLIDAAGRLLLNAVSGQPITFRINNTEVMQMSSSGLSITGTLTASGAATVAGLTYATGKVLTTAQVGETWIDFQTNSSFSGSWGNAGTIDSIAYQPLEYKRVGDLVFVRGDIKLTGSATMTNAGVKIGDFESGYRPATATMFLAHARPIADPTGGDSTPMNIRIHGSGEMRIYGMIGTNLGIYGYISIGMIVFSVL